jgi:uncharacterized protein (TIGR03067 family)
MPVRIVLVASAVLVLGFAPAPFVGKRPRANLAGLQGTWVVVTCKADGFDAGSCSNTEGPCVVRGAPVVIAGNRATFRFNGRVIDDWAIDLDVRTAHSTINLKGVARPRLRVLGICRLAGDTLTLCISDLGLARPSEFDGDKKGHTLLVLKRQRS